MQTTIPKIMHQIWSEKQMALPDYMITLSETWKTFHLDWDYEFWDDARITAFVYNEYPQYREAYLAFPFDIQRWDAVRYLILYTYGGLYADFDIEFLKPISGLLNPAFCNFALEPLGNLLPSTPRPCLTNAFMACSPKDPFMKYIIDAVFDKENNHISAIDYSMIVTKTTGPTRVSELYALYPVKNRVHLIPSEYVSPFSMYETRKIISGEYNDELAEKWEKQLEEAYAVHYFLGTWLQKE